jgi:hypothetical protein
MPTVPTITKTLRIPYSLHEAVLAKLQPGESFTAYVNKVLADSVREVQS